MYKLKYTWSQTISLSEDKHRTLKAESVSRLDVVIILKLVKNQLSNSPWPTFNFLKVTLQLFKKLSNELKILKALKQRSIEIKSAARLLMGNVFSVNKLDKLFTRYE